MLNGNDKWTVFNAFLAYQPFKMQGAGLHIRSNTVLSIQSTALYLYSQPFTLTHTLKEQPSGAILGFNTYSTSRATANS